MFKNYFTIAIRNALRHKVFSLINILGLAIGISASLVIYLIVDYHFSFDKFEPGADRIYRVVSDMTFSGEEFKNSGVPGPLCKTVEDEVTGLEQSAGFFNYGGTVEVPITSKPTPAVFKHEYNIVFADNGYFKMFPHQWLAGSPKAALEAPFQTVISEAIAKKYFPGVAYHAILGRRIIYNDSVETTVRGVVADWSQNTDLSFNQFVSFATARAIGSKNNFGLENWQSTNGASQLYLKLAPGITPAQMHGQLKKLREKYIGKNNDANTTQDWNLQPLSDVHFNAKYGSYFLPIANRTALYSLAATAVFLLLLGCINFINLTTAQSAQRAREIGIRKTMGSSQQQLVMQFLTETFFFTLAATILSVLFTPLILRLFADFIPTDLKFHPLQQPQILLFLALLALVVTLLAGSYPTYVLSGYKPVLVLKNQVYSNSGRTRTAWLRKTLTVSQFVIAQVFVMATVLVGKQIHYFMTKDLGFQREAILYFSYPINFNSFYARKPESKHTVLDANLRAMPGLKMVSLGGPPPASDGASSTILKYVDGKRTLETDVQFKYGDTNFLTLYGLRLLAGRNLQQSDSANEFIVNETYAHILGFRNPQDVIGKYITESQKQMPIVGVVADFHQHSLHEPIKPLVIACDPRNSFTFHVALPQQPPGSDAWQKSIAQIQTYFKQVYPKEDFDYEFFDESIAQFYKSDQDLSKLLTWATALSVIISCLGLLGLVIYTTNQRTKEIGIRKVLGATVAHLVIILSKDFLLLVLIAFAIAVPVAWWGLQQWLQKFAYRTTISWWVFAASGFGMLLLALVVLSARTVKAATSNPVKNLRTE